MSRKAANTLKPKGNVSVNDQWAETIRRTEMCERVTQVAVSFDDLQLDLTGREWLETRLWLDKVKGLIMNLNKTSTELVGRCSMKVCLFFKIIIMFVHQGFKKRLSGPELFLTVAHKVSVTSAVLILTSLWTFLYIRTVYTQHAAAALMLAS